MLIELISLLDFCLFLFYKICHHESPSVPQIWVLGMSHHQLPLEGMITSSWFLCRPRRSAEPHWGVESSHRHSWCLQTALSNRPEAVSERQVIYYLTEGKDPKSITSYSPEPGRFWFESTPLSATLLNQVVEWANSHPWPADNSMHLSHAPDVQKWLPAPSCTQSQGNLLGYLTKRICCSRTRTHQRQYMLKQRV